MSSPKRCPPGSSFSTCHHRETLQDQDGTPGKAVWLACASRKEFTRSEPAQPTHKIREQEFHEPNGNISGAQGADFLFSASSSFSCLWETKLHRRPSRSSSVCIRRRLRRKTTLPCASNAEITERDFRHGRLSFPRVRSSWSVEVAPRE